MVADNMIKKNEIRSCWVGSIKVTSSEMKRGKGNRTYRSDDGDRRITLNNKKKNKKKCELDFE